MELPSDDAIKQHLKSKPHKKYQRKPPANRIGAEVKMKMPTKKQQLIAFAADTCNIIETGVYQSFDGSMVDISQQISQAIQRSECFASAQDLQARLSINAFPRSSALVTVTAETTIACARRLRQELGEEGILTVLNFASAKNPGGGFLKGACAQEETLVISSALYGCLLKHQHTFYDSNRTTHDGIYTDNIIWSPDVPVFRDDRDWSLCSKPFPVSFITLPAVNAGVVATSNSIPKKEVESLVEKNMRKRIQMVLYTAASQGTHALVLGAYGCGCFRNDPSDVARWFREELVRNNAFYLTKFQQIVFAVYDISASHNTMSAFSKELGNSASYTSPQYRASGKGK